MMFLFHMCLCLLKSLEWLKFVLGLRTRIWTWIRVWKDVFDIYVQKVHELYVPVVIQCARFFSRIYPRVVKFNASYLFVSDPTHGDSYIRYLEHKARHTEEELKGRVKRVCNRNLFLLFSQAQLNEPFVMVT